MQNKAHSTLGASSADRWFNCPGSVALAAKFPNVESVHAAEGTAAHALAELCLKEKTWPADFLGTQIGDFEVTQDMVDAVQVYVDYVRGVARGGKLFFEKRFHLDFIDKRLFGTNDACVITPEGRLIVIDYKHGAGIAVDVESNPQLLYYTLGAAWDREEGTFHPYKDFENVIVQPRAEHRDGPVRSYRFTWPVLFGFKRTLENAVARVDNDPTLHPGDHCRFCPALGQCPAVHKEAMRIAKTDFTATPLVESLTPEQLSSMINYRSRLDKFLDAVEARAFQLLMSGEKIEGLKLVRGRTNRKWRNEEEVVKTFGPEHNNMIYQAPKLRSPADLEKDLGKDAVAPFVEKTEGELQVAPITDKRKDETPASADFKKEVTDGPEKEN